MWRTATKVRWRAHRNPRRNRRGAGRGRVCLYRDEGACWVGVEASGAPPSGHVPVSMPALKQELAYLKSGVTALKAELDVRKNDPPNADDEFVPMMTVRACPLGAGAEGGGGVCVRPGRAHPARPSLPSRAFNERTRVQKFYTTAAATLKDLEDKYATMEKTFFDAVQLYGEDPKSTTPEEFFSIFFRFCDAWQVSGATVCVGRGMARRGGALTAFT